MDNLARKCCICDNVIGVDPNGWAGGHNAEPVQIGRCCKECNEQEVLPARLHHAGYSKDHATKIVGMILRGF